jgi:probable HAF family extracellular repeat protein
MFRRCAMILIVLCLVFSSVGSASAVVSYNVTDLGTLGSTTSLPIGINAYGQVVGYSNVDSTSYHGFLYSGGTMADLGTWGGMYSDAYDINNSGQIAGSSTYANGTGHACVWTNGVATDLGVLAGDTGSQASAINNSGQVVGTSSGSTRQRAFLYSGGSKTDISRGNAWCYAEDINDSGQIVGSVGPNMSSQRAFLLSNGTITDLGPGSAHAINSAGQVVGYDADYHGFLYSNGTFTSLGNLGGYYSSSIPEDISAHGQIVGTSRVGDQLHSAQHAFLYSNGVMSDLNTLIDPVTAGGVLSYAYGINDSGMIIARLEIEESGGLTHAVLLTPIPEPSVFVLLGVGLLCLAGWALRRAGET